MATSARVMTSTTAEARSPPTIEMVVSWSTDTSPAMPKTTDTAAATSASASDVTAVSISEAAALSPITEPSRSDGR
jgi:hypothetical protein